MDPPGLQAKFDELVPTVCQEEGGGNMTELRAVLHQERRYWTIHLTKSSRNNISCYFETLKPSKRL